MGSDLVGDSAVILNSFRSRCRCPRFQRGETWGRRSDCELGFGPGGLGRRRAPVEARTQWGERERAGSREAKAIARKDYVTSERIHNGRRGYNVRNWGPHVSHLNWEQCPRMPFLFSFYPPRFYFFQAFHKFTCEWSNTGPQICGRKD